MSRDACRWGDADRETGSSRQGIIHPGLGDQHRRTCSTDVQFGIAPSGTSEQRAIESVKQSPVKIAA
jgi:hypothetical protein